MQDKIFHVGIYHLIISTVVLTKEEQDFLTELYNDSLCNSDFYITDEEILKLKRLYKMTISVLKENIKSLENKLELLEK